MTPDRGNGELRICGTVYGGDGALPAGAVVLAIERGLRSERTLGRAPIDPQGHFDLLTGSPAAPAFPLRGALIVRALDHDRPLAESPPRFDPPPKVVIDLAFGDVKGDGATPTELETIAKAIAPHLDGLSAAALTPE